jgi:hypothetical protein
MKLKGCKCKCHSQETYTKEQYEKDVHDFEERVRQMFCSKSDEQVLSFLVLNPMLVETLERVLPERVLAARKLHEFELSKIKKKRVRRVKEKQEKVVVSPQPAIAVTPQHKDTKE